MAGEWVSRDFGFLIIYYWVNNSKDTATSRLVAGFKNLTQRHLKLLFPALEKFPAAEIK